MKRLLSAFFCVVLAMIVVVHCQEDEMNLDVSIFNPDYEGSEQDQLSNSLDEQMRTAEDLCANLKCGDGEICIINQDKANCECNQMCEIPMDERQKICSSSNITYESDCHFLREKCWCRNNDQKCNDINILSEKLDYYGACKYIEQCTEEQKKVFPARMKIWLDEVLHILNDRKDLDPKYFNLVSLADEMKANKVEKYWTCGVAFEFCKLDESKDHMIQKEELTTLISSIKSLENCIQPFIDQCDTDKNDLISDQEWGVCLDLNDDDLTLLRDYC